MPIGAPAELWRVVPKHPANAWIRERLKSRGRGCGQSDVAYFTSRTLLLDVIYAAGAIEYTVGRIDSLGAEVAAYASREGVTSQASDEVPLSIVAPGVERVYYEYASLLTWVRTLDDRMRSKLRPEDVTLGLIPALAEGAFRSKVEGIFDRWRRDLALDGEQYLTDYGLHMHALPGSGSPSALVAADGTLHFPIPDRPTGPVYLFDQFTHDEERELLPFPHVVLDRVSVFIDELLSAFVRATKEVMETRGVSSPVAAR
jgi:hypothetical protein